MTPQSLTLEELSQEALRLWKELSPGAVLWLSGEIGTGKTTFARALTEHAQAEPARSPTFALVHEYLSPEGLLVHADCYRLREPVEAIDMDFPELMRRARLLMVEWPERAGTYAPPPNAHLQFSFGESPDRRTIERVR
ncbi:MAG: tRNA (adenosine(37)-N6)-threonylcarbamoyltransferase complex ATPase subunit type 1 TsaE [Gemmatimonadales bacterium]